MYTCEVTKGSTKYTKSEERSLSLTKQCLRVKDEKSYKGCSFRTDMDCVTLGDVW